MAAASTEAASLRPLFRRLTARGATAGAKAAALAGLVERLVPLLEAVDAPTLLAPATCQALDEGALDALVEVLGAPSAGRQARLDALVLIGACSVAAAFKRAVVQHPRAVAAVVRLLKQPHNKLHRGKAIAALQTIVLRSPQASVQQLTPALFQCW
jgi:hypothetical protein